MKKGIIPHLGSVQMHDGMQHTKGRIFGDKPHLTSTTPVGDLILPLTADVITANVPDNKM